MPQCRVLDADGRLAQLYSQNMSYPQRSIGMIIRQQMTPSAPRIHILKVLFCAFAFLLCACQKADVSSSAPYNSMIGKRYTTLARINAFGFYLDDGQKTTIEVISLIPSVGVQGRLVAFTKPIEAGSHFTIVGARRQPALEIGGSIIKYRIVFDKQDLPKNIPVEIALFRGNEGIKGDLNTKLYEAVR